MSAAGRAERPRDWHAVTQLTERVFAAVDWSALGDIYFHEDGEALWQQRRPRVVALGRELGEQLGARVCAGGTSLWVGAGVAELPVMLGEVALQGRTVVAANLIERECEVLNQALSEAAPDVALRYTAGDARQVAAGVAYDHLGCISVFTDPERWPMLSGVAYGRLPPVQLDLEQFAREREQARELAAALFGRLDMPGWITTSPEEVAWFLELCQQHERAVEAADELIETAVVGDPVGFLRIG